MQTRINKEQVSHLVIRGLRKTNYIWLPKKVDKTFFGLFTYQIYFSGFYKKGNYETIWNYKNLNYDEILIDNVVHKVPKVTVFSGGKEILEEIFDDVETAKEWATENFPNCEIVER